MKILQALFIFLILLAPMAVAQDITAEKFPPSIRTNGDAIVTAKPDRAEIDIGVITQAGSSQIAVLQNAQKLETVLTQLKNILGPGANIKTISYSLSPNYRYPSGGGEPTITGYTATNVVRVTLDDLTQVGKVIDAATSSGANRIQSLHFTLKDSQSVEAQALTQAAAEARKKADALAAALDLRIIRVLSVSESSPAVVPVRDVAYARAETASTPIEPGTIEVRASVSLVVEIAPR
ncbi:MAG TPA: SIMPL domain-containing protein [Pyrinomonadaceae bacterium]|jgi:uncharacterized protein YggE|nr:SIMPL domain-containing protein [Pyrinomonadaceae bacterium]